MDSRTARRWKQEVYSLIQSADLALRKVPLGMSPELVGRAAVPRSSTPLHVLPACQRLVEWLTESHYLASKEQDLRFVVSRESLDYHDPLGDANLLSDFAYLDCSDEEALKTFFSTHGDPGFGSVHEGGAYADRYAGHVPTLCVRNGKVDMASDNESDSFTVFSPVWVLRDYVARLRLGLELAAAIKATDAAKARAIIGPLDQVERSPFAGNPVTDWGAPMYEWEDECWRSVGTHGTTGDILICDAKDLCPDPDERRGWFLNSAISEELRAFGPCGWHRPREDAEYLVGARQLLAGLLTGEVKLWEARMAVSPVHDERLRSDVMSRFLPAVFLARRLFSDSDYEQLPVYEKPPLSQVFGRMRRSANAAESGREPLFRFHRIIQGSAAAAWYQLLDVLVRFSELRRCQFCGALFGADHGNQDYCPPARQGGESACRQAAKKQRQRNRGSGPNAP